MVCNHVMDLYKYVKENKLKVSAIDILTVECKKCQDKAMCNSID